MEVCLYSYFQWCEYFEGLCVSFVTTDLLRYDIFVTKITFLWTHSLPICFEPIFNSMNYGHIIKMK